MRKTLTALLAATTLGVAALPSSAEARWGWGWGWGGFGVGLATGAIVGGALAAGAYNPYSGYGYGYGYPILSGLRSGLLRLLLRRPAILRLLSLLAPTILALLVTERSATKCSNEGSDVRRLRRKRASGGGTERLTAPAVETRRPDLSAPVA
jgi:hypothetical protein